MPERALTWNVPEANEEQVMRALIWRFPWFRRWLERLHEALLTHDIQGFAFDNELRIYLREDTQLRYPHELGKAEARRAFRRIQEDFDAALNEARTR